LDSSDVTQLIILALLILLSAFFSSAETAFDTINKIRVKTLLEDGNKRAETILKLLDNSEKMLSAILIGNNLVNLSACALTTFLAINLWGNVGVGIAIGIITLFILIFGEIVPKTFASFYTESIALTYAKIIYAWMILLTPIIFIVNKLSFVVLKIFKIDASIKSDLITEIELRTIVEASHEDGVIESEERKMINNVFDFGDSQAKDIMIPRIDMVFVDVDSTYSELIEIYKEEKFTRLPVYEDTTDNVIGIINVKDLLLYDPQMPFNIRNFLRDPYFTYEYKKTSELLMEMRKSSINFAIVLDEYGATAGLVTLEDLLEEIVGEIRDEYDTDEEDLVKKINDYEYIIEGSMKLDDVNDLLNLDIASDDYDSIGGIIIELLDHLPEAGEEVTTKDGIRLVAETVDKKRIEKVHMYIPEELLTIAELDTTEDESIIVIEDK
jgi:CBS domain containing-hemolysin-like protein